MKFVINIPEEDIPKVQGTMDIHLCFCEGKLCQCDYPFDADIEQEYSVSTEKTVRWIEERTHMECPNCHDIWHYEENQTERFKFCPTCGVKMREVGEQCG